MLANQAGEEGERIRVGRHRADRGRLQSIKTGVLLLLG